MSAKLTPRMKAWLESMGAHVATATAGGWPTVTVVATAGVEGATVTFPLSKAQAAQIEGNLAENRQVAIAPGQLGSVRAPYQFKGAGVLRDGNLVVEVDEIYCTRPGPESAQRMDTFGYEEMARWEEERWRDLPPTG